jgi:hypothetical protein
MIYERLAFSLPDNFCFINHTRRNKSEFSEGFDYMECSNLIQPAVSVFSFNIENWLAKKLSRTSLTFHYLATDIE